MLTTEERATCAKIAAEITKHPEHWTQKHWARNAAQNKCYVNDPDAISWCALGLIWREFPSRVSEVQMAFSDIIGTSLIGDWNNEEGRVPSEVATVFSKLAAAES